MEGWKKLFCLKAGQTGRPTDRPTFHLLAIGWKVGKKLFCLKAGQPTDRPTDRLTEGWKVGRLDSQPAARPSDRPPTFHLPPSSFFLSSAAPELRLGCKTDDRSLPLLKITTVSVNSILNRANSNHDWERFNRDWDWNGFFSASREIGFPTIWLFLNRDWVFSNRDGDWIGVYSADPAIGIRTIGLRLEFLMVVIELFPLADSHFPITQPDHNR